MYLTWLRRQVGGRATSAKLRIRKAAAARRFRPCLHSLENRLLPATYLVTNTNDSGPGSLRQAIMDSNSNPPGPNTIDFSIGSGVQTISPTFALPLITVPVVLDGTSQPGYSGTPLIELDGSQAGSEADGLMISAGRSTVKGLAINRFGGLFGGIWLTGSGGNTIVGNFIGTDVTGTQALGNAHHGVLILDSSNNTIGGTDPTARNLISANQSDAIQIIHLSENSVPTGNVVQGNFIGTDVTGTQALANRGDGVQVVGCANSLIGGTTPGAGNVIAGNSGRGVSLSRSDFSGTGASGNLVQGNLIGTTAAGTTALGNGQLGVAVSGAGTSNNTIGGTAPEARNVLSGSIHNNGVGIFGGATANVVEGNYIGTDGSGAVALGNAVNGVSVSDAGTSNNTIGGTAAGAGNLISGNLGNGIQFFGGSSSNCVEGNFIGTDVSGTRTLGNTASGVAVSGASNTTMGGTAAGAGNLISGNGIDGVYMSNTSTTGNLVAGNFIGTDSTGTISVPNVLDGVAIDAGASANTVGGIASGAGNLIAGNGRDGILLGPNSATTANVIQGNFIGTDVSGRLPLGNGRYGVRIHNQSTNNTLGGTVAGAGNIIAANVNSGVNIADDGTTGTVVQGNYIGTDRCRTIRLPNGKNGVEILSASGNTIGGTVAGAGNTIANNANDGVLVDTGTGNAIQENSIFASGNVGIELVNGGNHNQESPVVTSATSGGGSITVVGYLQSAPNTTFTVEFFANLVCNPSGYGEGEDFLGFLTVTTDDSGYTDFTATFGLPQGQFIAATATDPDNNTSAFSACVAVSEGGSPEAGKHLALPSRLTMDQEAAGKRRGDGLPAVGEFALSLRDRFWAVDAAFAERTSGRSNQDGLWEIDLTEREPGPGDGISLAGPAAFFVDLETY